MLFVIPFFIAVSYLILFLLYPVFSANEIIITYGIHPFDICSKNPDLWKILKTLYVFCCLFSNLLISHLIYSRILIKLPLFKIKNKTHKNNFFQNNFQKDDLHLLIGKNSSEKNIFIPESGLYQNFLVTGTIGSGKTSSAMYPFTKQLIEFNHNNLKRKIGMLILDVKGNFYQQVHQYAKQYNLENDLIVIGLHSNIYYNPLHKPNLKPQVLANRLKTILLLFSENNTESYWLDKAEEILTECIKLCRLYNDNYVTFLEIHKLITMPNYYKEKYNKILKLTLLDLKQAFTDEIGDVKRFHISFVTV